MFQDTQKLMKYKQFKIILITLKQQTIWILISNVIFINAIFFSH